MTSNNRVPALSSAIMLGLACLSLATTGAEIPTRGPVPFATFDSDGDGYIDEQEFQRVHDARIQQRAAEGRPMRNMRQAPEFADIDADGDGRVSPQEHQAHHQRRQQMRHASPPASAN